MFVRVIRLRAVLIAAAAILLTTAGILAVVVLPAGEGEECGEFGFVEPYIGAAQASGSSFIKWVDFTPTYKVLKKALDYDVKSHRDEGTVKLDWIELLAYLGAKYGGEFKRYSERDLDTVAEKLKAGASMDELTANMKYYNYYREAYGAVLDGFVGQYRVEVPLEDGTTEWRERYGLKAFSPVAKGYYYNDFDDFGVGRSYGYKRKHLGHDLMGNVGTPIIAIESGIVEELGWNQYGGWRIGIRSFDKKRYYYYAHLRQNRPYAAGLEKGATVKAGDVIGYMGRTGYSSKENVNNITQTHLHLGLQLIFDESQKDGVNQIWIDLYPITKLLLSNKSAVQRGENKEYGRLYGFEEIYTEDN